MPPTPSPVDQVATVKASLLPPPPWKARLERLIECLPRRRFVPRCRPLQQVSQVAGASERWLSMGDDPAFVLEFDGGRPPHGWVYLEAALHRSMGNRVAMLHFDRGQGFELQQGEFIPSNLRGSVRELVYIPDDVVALRWDPCEARGYFSQSPLVFHEVGYLERQLRMADRLYSFHGQGQPVADAAGQRRRLGLTGAYLALRQERRAQAAETYRAFVRAESQAAGPAAAAGGAAATAPHFVIHLGWDSGAESPAAAWPGAPQPGVPCSLIDWRTPDLAALKDASAHPQAWHLCMRAGDQFAPGALQRLARCIHDHPQAQVVYSDHDFIGVDGERHSPSFKPDWDPDLYYTHNFVANLCAVSGALPEAAAVFSHRPTPAAFSTLVLAAARTKGGQAIEHLPLVLCHRQPDPRHGDPYGGEPAWPEALAAHPPLAGAVLEPGLRPHTCRVRWPLPEPAPLVSVIVPTRDRIELLRPCVDSLLARTEYSNYELIVVDNDSTTAEVADYLVALAKRPRCRVLRHPGRFNYSAINNAAVAQARGELLLFLNNDIEVVTPGWMGDLVRQAVRPEVGVVGAKLLYPDGSVQHAGVVLGIGGIAGHVHRFLPGSEPGYGGRAELSHGFSAVTGACLMLRHAVFESVGGFNAERLAVAFNDVDLCLRVRRRGLRNLLEPGAVLVHHESMTRGQDDTDEKRAILQRERAYMLQHWQREIAEDPAYNLNLSHEREDFSFRTGGAGQRRRA